jgi:hypothetical protein
MKTGYISNGFIRTRNGQIYFIAEEALKIIDGTMVSFNLVVNEFGRDVATNIAPLAETPYNTYSLSEQLS